jgi:hypothetical protein
MNWLDWARWPLQQLSYNSDVLAELPVRFARLEGLIMASAADVARRIDAATNEVASDLQAARDALQSLRDSVETDKQAAVDQALGSLDTSISRLEELGRDPQNPVPDPGTGGGTEPTPSDGTDVTNPTPVDENGNPVDENGNPI